MATAVRENGPNIDTIQGELKLYRYIITTSFLEEYYRNG